MLPSRMTEYMNSPQGSIVAAHLTGFIGSLLLASALALVMWPLESPALLIEECDAYHKLMLQRYLGEDRRYVIKKLNTENSNWDKVREYDNKSEAVKACHRIAEGI